MVGGLLVRLPALAMACVALVAFVAGFALLPPALEGWILASGKLAPASGAGAWGCALLLWSGSLFAARRAARLWRESASRDPRKVLFALVAIGLGSVAALGLAELTLRVGLQPEKVLSGEALFRTLWVESRRAAGSSTLNPEFHSDSYDPELGWVPRPGFASDSVNIDAAGLRSTHPYARSKPAGRRRIVVVGDSFTFGTDVADEEIYTEVLVDLLAGTDVINLGVHGYGTDQQYLRLRRDGFAYGPDLVVLAYYKTNAQRNVLAFRDYAKPRFDLVDGELLLLHSPVPPPSDPRWATPPRTPSYLAALVQRNVRKFVDRTSFAPEWPLTTAILDAAAAECRKHDAAFMVLYIPAARPTLSSTPEAAEAVLAAWAARTAVPLLNLRPLLLAMPADDRARLYAGHWTAFGHRVAAQHLARFIVERQLLTPRDTARALDPAAD